MALEAVRGESLFLLEGDGYAAAQFQHHHASLCIAAYGFLTLERLRGSKKIALDAKRLPYPKASARVGRGPMQRHQPFSIATLRFRVARVIARHLSRCPCCGTAHRIIRLIY